MRDQTRAFIEAACAIPSVSDLRLLLAETAAALGFSHFAVTEHVQFKDRTQRTVCVHNYPDRLSRYHEEQHLGCTDPVHRACYRTALGFTWSELPKFVDLTRHDIRILRLAADEGVSEGFTVPVHVPGELSGSCSFATAKGFQIQTDNLPAAQVVGAFAFEAARRLTRASKDSPSRDVHLSDRERECLIWIARGKADSEIATILGISTHTVNQYVKHARAIFDVVSRSQLVARALFNGTISFPEIVGS